MAMRKIAFNQLSANTQKLPRLPIPPLNDTFNRYRDSVKPLKKQEKVNAHLAKLDAFQESSAAEMQRTLVDQDAKAAKEGVYPNSYIEALWDEGYLGFRGPLAVNINPGISIKPLPGVRGQADTAAAYVTGILRWIEKLTTDQLDVPEKNPLDVSGLAQQFAFSRVPKAPRDEFFNSDVRKSRTVTVLCKNHLYLVNVKDENGLAYTPEVLSAAFSHVALMAQESQPGPALSYLTSGGRSDWSTSYADLISECPENETLLKSVQESLIVICLDSEQWGKDNSAKLASMLHGGTEAGNRWYDKHQLIIDPDGATCVCYEHSFSDGMNWVRWMNEVYCSISGEKSGFSPLPVLKTAPAAESSTMVRHLEVKAGKAFGARIRTAEQEVQKLIKGVLLDEVVLPFGKTKLKQLGMSPDAFCQILMHWSYYQLRSKVAPTYESCSTAGFWHGRTETIRTATNEMRSLITHTDLDSINSLSTENGEVVVKKMKAAADTHALLAKAAKNGLGVDRHLLALKEVVKSANDTNGLAFFNDELFQYSGTWVMSTSNVSMPYIDSFNFGPVTPHGIGIGYGIHDDHITMGLSSFKLSSKTKLKDFCKRVRCAGEDLIALLERNQQK